jgi:hypothetical protein
VLEDKIVAQRKRLAEDGLDAGARTIELPPLERTVAVGC